MKKMKMILTASIMMFENLLNKLYQNLNFLHFIITISIFSTNDSKV